MMNNVGKLIMNYKSNCRFKDNCSILGKRIIIWDTIVSLGSIKGIIQEFKCLKLERFKLYYKPGLLPKPVHQAVPVGRPHRPGQDWLRPRAGAWEAEEDRRGDGEEDGGCHEEVRRAGEWAWETWSSQHWCEHQRQVSWELSLIPQILITLLLRSSLRTLSLDLD